MELALDSLWARIHACEEEALSLSLIGLHPSMSALLSSARANLRAVAVQARALTNSDSGAVNGLSRALAPVERQLTLVRGSIRILRVASSPASSPRP